MEYRALGRTGMEAGVIGLGCEHLDGKPYEQTREVIDAALGQGVNIIDVFMPGDEVRRNIGRALGTRRRDVIIQGHIGSVDLNQQYDISRDPEICRDYFERLLRHLNTDYIDIGMLFFVDGDDHFESVFHGGIAEYAQKLKQQGTIRAIGASSHDPATALRVVETGLVDVLMFSVNPAFDLTPAGVNVLESLENGFDPGALYGADPLRQKLYRTCESMGVAITVMKTYGAGKLLSREHTPFGSPMTPAQCIHYALSRPAVASAMIGCQTREEVLEAAGYLAATDDERDYSAALRSGMRDFRGNCVYCNHCRPCPAGIDIAAVTRYLDIAVLDEANIPPSVRQHYLSLEARASACVECGSCEERCPFGVGVMANMRRAAAIFGD